MDVENLREALKSRLRDLGISAREASRRAGFNVGYVGDILDGRSKAPDADRILKLAETLDMSAADLLGESVNDSHRGGGLPFGAETRAGGRMVPIYAAPLPINRQFVPFGTAPIGRMPCPAMLLDAPEAFAARVPNNSAAPRFHAGETILINPGASPAVGDFVWVRRKDESVAIARLAALGADSFELEFIGFTGGDARATVAYDEVRGIKRIVASVY